MGNAQPDPSSAQILHLTESFVGFLLAQCTCTLLYISQSMQMTGAGPFLLPSVFIACMATRIYVSKSQLYLRVGFALDNKLNPSGSS